MKNIIRLSFLIGMGLLPLSVIGQESAEEPVIVLEDEEVAKTESILDERTESTEEAIANPFSISQHRRNYLLPITYVSTPGTDIIQDLNDENVDNTEAKYQISVKLPLYVKGNDASGLYLGFSVKSFWQIYNSDVSKPFRATDYEPELFYTWNNELSIAGLKFNQLQLGFNHQSNGQSNERSRSWNRLYASALISDESSFYYVKAWYRIPEDEKETPSSPKGDDNPDITRFLGNIELGYGTTWGQFNITGLVRNNLRTSNNKGSVEVNVTYPLSENYDLLLQYFKGYGDSLIDYNRHQQRIGLGVQLKFL